MEYRRLRDTKMEVSVLGFGASSLGGVFHEVNFDECAETVRNALEGGINFIDVAPAYGETLAESNLEGRSRVSVVINIISLPRLGLIVKRKVITIIQRSAPSAACTRASND